MGLTNFFKKTNVQQGATCEISEFCSLENVKMGNNVRIGDGAQLKNVIIGDGAKIGVNVRFYSPDARRPVKIGRQCWLSYGVFGEATGGEIILGDYATIAHRTIFLTSSGPGKNNAVMDALYPEKRDLIHIGKYSWIGAQCTLLPGSLLGEGVVFGAHALALGGTYDAWTVYGGVPAKVIRKIDLERVNRAKAAVK